MHIEKNVFENIFNTVMKETPAPTCDAAFSSTVPQRRSGVPHTRVNSPASTRHIGRMTFQYKFVLLWFWFFCFTYNIICEQLIIILLILFIYEFTNIEATQVITSMFKSSMKILLFQWSQVSRHPNWRPYINAWFQRFDISVNF